MGGKLAKLLKELDLSKGMAPATVDLIFSEFDKENRGHLSKTEVRLLVTEWCTVHHRQDFELTIDAFMRRFDVNSDGKITKQALVSGGVAALSKTSREWSELLRTQLIGALRTNDKAVAKLLLEGVTSLNLSTFFPPFERQSSSGPVTETSLKDPHNVNLDAKMAQTLRDAMEGNVSVKSFSLVVTDELGLDGVSAISKLIQPSQHINVLNLSFRETKPKCLRGWTSFAKILETNHSITDVTWSDDLSSELAESLADSLPKSSSIRSFSFQNCSKLDVEGVEALIKMLQFVKLHRIEFDHIDLGDSGVAALAHALSKNMTITQVSCKTVCMGPNGAACLAKTIETSTCLEYLDLVGNLLGEQGIVSIASAITRNRKLSRLKLGWGVHFLPVGRGLNALRGAIELQLLERNGLLSKEESKVVETHSQIHTTTITFVDLISLDKTVTIGGTKVYPSQHALLMDCLRTTSDFSALDVLLKKRLLTSQILVNRRMSPQETEIRKKSLLSRVIDALNRSSSQHSSLTDELEISVFNAILERFPEIFDSQLEDHTGTSYALSCGPALRHILEARNRNNRADKAFLVAENAASEATAAANIAHLRATCANAWAASIGAAVKCAKADSAVAAAGRAVSSVGKLALLARTEAEKQKADRKAFGASSLLFY